VEPTQFFTASRVLIVAGKGGVGKTTVAAAAAVAAAGLGLDVMLIEVEGKHGLAGVFSTEALTYQGTIVHRGPSGARVTARAIAAEEALVDYFREHGLGRFGRTLEKMQVLDTLATSTPGLKDLIVLGRIKQIERDHPDAVIIVDAPASGHAISFLQSARGLQQTIVSGPIRRQADEAVAMLNDPTRAQVLLVTLAEETPVNELIETAYRLEDEVGLSLTPLVVNAVEYRHRDLAASLPPSAATLAPERAGELAAVGSFWRRRAALHDEQRERLAVELPLAQICLPRLLSAHLGPPELAELAAALVAGLAAIEDLG
jgi:hypothetical protein